MMSQLGGLLFMLFVGNSCNISMRRPNSGKIELSNAYFSKFLPLRYAVKIAQNKVLYLGFKTCSRSKGSFFKKLMRLF